MKTITYWLLSAVILLSCGVLRADPTSPSHSLWDHKELFTPAFCVASYAIVLDQLPFGTPRIVAEDMAGRGSNLYLMVDESLPSIGHTSDEWGELMEQVFTDIKDNWTAAAWHAGLEKSDCLNLTKPWAKFVPPGLEHWF